MYSKRKVKEYRGDGGDSGRRAVSDIAAIDVVEQAG